MINVDTRIMRQLDSNEFWLMLHLVKFLGKKKSVWPSNKTICDDTGWHIEKVQRIKSALVEKGFLVIEFRGNKSNKYRFKTKYLATFNGVDGEYLNEKEDTGKSDMLDTGKSSITHTGKSDNELLAIEELTIELSESKDSGQQKPLFSEGEVPIKGEGQKVNEREARARDFNLAYKEFVRIWCEAFPEFGFNAIDGRKMKSIIRQTKLWLSAGGKVSDHTAAANMFQYIINYLKKGDTWLYGKDLSTVDSKYRSLIIEIKNGKPKPTKTPSARDIIDSL